MAIKATVYKAELQISDMDRHYYQAHALTLAQHPSETLQRMMIRLLIFAIHADEKLEFTRGLSSDDEPDLWQKSDDGEIDVWIDLGQPDEKRIRKACGRAKAVYIYSYSQRSASVWWQKVENKLSRFDNLHIVTLDDAPCAELVQLVERSMRLQCSIQDAELWLGNDQCSVHIKPEVWK